VLSVSNANVNFRQSWSLTKSLHHRQAEWYRSDDDFFRPRQVLKLGLRSIESKGRLQPKRQGILGQLSYRGY
jgi:hypothetical protein